MQRPDFRTSSATRRDISFLYSGPKAQKTEMRISVFFYLTINFHPYVQAKDSYQS
jgi:hypothetical protein